MKKILLLCITFLIVQTTFSQYPDQWYFVRGTDTLSKILESSSGIKVDTLTNSYVLDDNVTEGYFILKEHSFAKPFNQGLPSWNGHAPNDKSAGFMIKMRFKIYGTWSEWITVGYWDKLVWTDYGATSFSGGKVDVDYVKTDTYINTFQFKVLLKRNSLSTPSPSVKQLSFVVSDSKRTDEVDINSIVNDNPPQIFIPTDFVYQMAVDDEIGGSICSPTTVSMIIKSYGIEVDPYEFALRTYDDYWKLFGVWPRVVQHANEYGLVGWVSRYRTWSDAYDVLKKGGRIAMSVGKPLYSGHLMMLAGFDENGNPIVHDPAKSAGYSKIYDKKDLSESWFNKGGISYTFFKDSNFTYTYTKQLTPSKFEISIYPNPFSSTLIISINTDIEQKIDILIFDITGRYIKHVGKGLLLNKGNNNILLSTSSLPSNSIYILKIITRSGIYNKRILKI